MCSDVCLFRCVCCVAGLLCCCVCVVVCVFVCVFGCLRVCVCACLCDCMVDCVCCCLCGVLFVRLLVGGVVCLVGGCLFVLLFD